MSDDPRPGAELAASVATVRERIAAAARRAGRPPDAVTLVAAVKTVAAERVAAVAHLGVVDLGENRAQELLATAPEIVTNVPAVRWHFIGQLQRNKVRALAPWVTCWQSVDRDALVPVIARHASGATVLVEVNLAGETTKGGCASEDAPALVDAARAAGLRVDGLMTVPPHGEDPRPWFARLRDLAGRLELEELSMGMTDDFEIAIEEGATIVRIGRALFGDRPVRPIAPDGR